jgi:hypothetical protein
MKDHIMRKLLVIICLIVPIGASANDGHPEQKKAAALVTPIAIGQQVITVNAVNVRQTAAGTLLGSQPAGAVATVISGPTSGTLGGTAYVWWGLNFTTGVDGWVASDNLAVSGSSVPPPPSSSVLSDNNMWLAGQSVSPKVLIPGATVTPDAALSNNFTLKTTSNFTLAFPVNLKPGQTINLWITQDATGHRVVTWGPGYQAAGGPGTLILSTAANAKDMVSCQADTATTLTCTIQAGVR